MSSVDPGLCGRCAHCQKVDGARSRFYLCRLAASDARFHRYPVVPVRACDGFQEQTGPNALEAEDRPRGSRQGKWGMLD